ncbi:MAG: hypothetical protein A3K06_00100 [Candidatus Doudnabacteria bacterium RIFCSPHIGHO2_01_52_17]|uniref:Uncharacterized protein n=1 Tax=Candidatus Doudnabacteria bacterium RIFCSPHIGHO2_01_52_17 TaxID=1817820 RepID=A0A1F5NAZ0_9BACT|nr:MAG: hypothetical protein A3K06_00100 [Candidatus Doudnabacteria bacterium RIFCSPHIGHO2_01_52_17]
MNLQIGISKKTALLLGILGIILVVGALFFLAQVKPIVRGIVFLTGFIVLYLVIVAAINRFVFSIFFWISIFRIRD